MKIQAMNKPSPVWKKGKVLPVIMLVSSVILASLYGGMVLHKTGLANVFNELVRASSKLRIIQNYFKSFTTTPEHITINIKYLDYQKLAYEREMALAKGVLLSSAKDYVPARIQYKDKTIKAKIRLKGDWAAGLMGDKWAFRIKISGDNTLLGMKQFSIHHPKERNYIYELLFHQALKRESIISPRYEFIRVTLNGNNLGIYALEEHFGKRLIENNRYREGPIIKFNEDIYWADILALKDTGRMPADLPAQLSADIDAFDLNRILKDPSLYKQFIIAKDLLESFRKGILPTHKVFDIKKLAKYFAISDILHAFHGAGRWHNLRFYYNPITSLLEPIGFDAMVLSAPWEMLALMAIDESPEAFQAKAFSDIIFFEEYMRALEQISQRSYLDELFEDINIPLQKNLNIIYREWPYFTFSTDIFYQNQRYIQTLLNPSKGLHAYFHKSYNTHLELELGNIQSFPIEVLGVSYKDSLSFSSTERTVLLPRIPAKPINYQIVTFSFPKDLAWSDNMISDLKIKYRLVGTRPIRYEKVFPYSHLSDNLVENDFIRQPPNAPDFKFLSIDESAKKIFIKPGHWQLEQNLIIPKGYKVICPEGVQLNISNSAKVLSFSPLEFNGSEENPIVIYSADSTGQGLVVMKADQNSILRYVIFKDLSSSSQQGWELTGAVTFYESAVEITHGQFLNNKSEDGLNIIRSDFSIDKTLFEKTSSDAFDADFSNGKITNSSFIYCGNDGIDICGSTVTLQQISVRGAGDKGLSIGEDSRMEASSIKIKDAKVAVASKDMSEVSIENITLTDCKIGLAAYQKKSEFGPSSMKIQKLKMEGIKFPYLAEEGSTLIVEETPIKSDQDNLKEILSAEGAL